MIKLLGQCQYQYGEISTSRDHYYLVQLIIKFKLPLGLALLIVIVRKFRVGTTFYRTRGLGPTALVLFWSDYEGKISE